MKKLMIFIVCVLLLSGCSVFDYEMMVCNYNNSPTTTYEIRYTDKKIRDIMIVEQIDLSNLSQKDYNNQLRRLRNATNVIGYARGIDTYLEENGTDITKKIVINIKSYNCINDRLGLIPIELSEDDLASVEALRTRLVENSFACDVLVTTQPQEMEVSEDGF